MDEKFLLDLLRVCAAAEPRPLYPSQYARETGLDRDKLDAGLDELRRRGLVKLTEWVKDFGQGRALTEAGHEALRSRRLVDARPASAPSRPRTGGTLSVYERGELVREAFVNPPRPYVTQVLLAANILVYVYGMLYAAQNHLDPEAIMNRAVVSPALIRRDPDNPRRPQFERIFLYFFVHIGLLHLFMNMYFLYTLGPLLEAMWGWWRFLTVYLTAGLVGGCMVLLVAFLRDSNRGAAGASGSMYGLFAAFIVWYRLNRDFMPPRLSSSISRNIGINLILLIGINFLEGISWEGHLGGAIGGFLAALLLHVQRFHPNPGVRVLALCGIPVVLLSFFTAVLWLGGWL
jgi:membrane associated rhomboid family serine protease